MSRLILNAVDGYLPDIVVVDSGPEVSPGADDVLVEIEAARSTAQTSSSQPVGRAGRASPFRGGL